MTKTTTKSAEHIQAEFLKTLQVECHYWATRNQENVAETKELEMRWNMLTEMAGRMFGDDVASEMFNECKK